MQALLAQPRKAIMADSNLMSKSSMIYAGIEPTFK
jgi:hypothetical protein